MTSFIYQFSTLYMTILLIICNLSLTISKFLLQDENLVNYSTIHNSKCKKFYDLSTFNITLNTTINPCDDFYAFTCGKLLYKENNITVYNVQDNHDFLTKKIDKELLDLLLNQKKTNLTAINNLYKFFNVCVDFNENDKNINVELYNKIKLFNSSLFMENSFNIEQKTNLTELLVKHTMLFRNAFFYSYSHTCDNRNGSSYILLLNHVKKYSDKRFLILENSKKNYKNYMTKYLKLFAIDNNLTLNKIEVEKVYNFEMEFAQKFFFSHKLFGQLSYRLENLSSFQKLFNKINWKNYFKLLAPSNMHDYFDNDPYIYVLNNGYFENLTNLLDSTDNKIIKNFIIWRIIKNYQLEKRYKNQVIGNKKSKNKEQECFSIVSKKLPYAVSALYSQNFINQRNCDLVLKMIKEFRVLLKKLIQYSDWINNISKNSLFEKLDNIIIFVCNDSFTFNNTLLDDYYNSLKLHLNDNYTTIDDKINKFYIHKEISILKNIFFRSKSKEFFKLNLVNAYYKRYENTINLFPGHIRKPFFDYMFPKVINYGRYGFIIGHELLHSLDRIGINLDKDGNYKKWWDDVFLDIYNNKTQCFIEQYSNYRLPNTNLSIDGNLTFDENFADNTGLKLSYKAYKDYIKNTENHEDDCFINYTNDQMFFISYGTHWCSKKTNNELIKQIKNIRHSPSRFRVNGVVSNLPDFAKAFNCPIGSPMNPEKKCLVF